MTDMRMMSNAPPLRRQRPLLGTFVEIGVLGDGYKAQAAVTAAFGVIERLQARLSYQSPTSDLTRLNAAPGEWVQFDMDCLRVLRLALELTRITGGLFNCTVGGALVEAGVLPNHGAAPGLPLGTAEDVEISGRRARLKRPIRITLDGIAKGFAADRAISTLRGQGMTTGWVNAGGDIRCFGGAAVPVQRREADGSFTPLGVLRDGAIATSQARPLPNPRFPALIVAREGSRPGPGTWTVLAASAWRADALTKVAATAPAKDRAAWIARLRGHLVIPGLERAA